nr:hypothetical protein [Tanacetum cinerariifolium]
MVISINHYTEMFLETITQEGNVGQSIDASNDGNVSINVYNSPATPSCVPKLPGPTLYAKLVTGEPSRKSVNFRTFIAPTGRVLKWLSRWSLFELTAFSEDELSAIATKLVLGSAQVIHIFI